MLINDNVFHLLLVRKSLQWQANEVHVFKDSGILPK